MDARLQLALLGWLRVPVLEAERLDPRDQFGG